jgi:hypothetical protein
MSAYLIMFLLFFCFCFYLLVGVPRVWFIFFLSVPGFCCVLLYWRFAVSLLVVSNLCCTVAFRTVTFACFHIRLIDLLTTIDSSQTHTFRRDMTMSTAAFECFGLRSSSIKIESKLIHSLQTGKNEHQIKQINKRFIQALLMHSTLLVCIKTPKHHCHLSLAANPTMLKSYSNPLEML